MTVFEVRTTGEVKSGQPSELERSIPGVADQPLKDFAGVHDGQVYLPKSTSKAVMSGQKDLPTTGLPPEGWQA